MEGIVGTVVSWTGEARNGGGFVVECARDRGWWLYVKVSSSRWMVGCEYRGSARRVDQESGASWGNLSGGASSQGEVFLGNAIAHACQGSDSPSFRHAAQQHLAGVIISRRSVWGGTANAGKPIYK